MKKTKYVIDGYYEFDVTADGARPTSRGQNGIHLQFEHDEVMEMGEYFYDEDPTEVDFDYNFGIKEELDELLADMLAEEYEEEWKSEHEGDEEEVRAPDFYAKAYEVMGDMYHSWDEQFKQDCIDYYLAHKDDEE